MSAPVEFVWRRKVGSRAAQPVHALAPTATTTAMCGTSTSRDTHWLEPLAGQPRCRVCISTIAREYPSSMHGLGDMAAVLALHPVEVAEMLDRAFDAYANDSQGAG